jgi:rhodanese-related sulfurtransferase
MNCKRWAPLMLLLVSCYAMSGGAAGRVPGAIQTKTDRENPFNAELIAAEELKAKLARNEPVTIVDVRDTHSYVGSNGKIKGSIYVKLRRLRYRLSFPPLKDVPRDSEVVTYCACPHDEASLQAAQILQDAGFKRVRVLKGGWQMWLKVNGQVEPRPKA